MVQEFHVLRCYSCQTFQVQQVKKSKKWNCKMCGEKQSLIKEFARGSGVDCRRHVQKLNARRGEKLEQDQKAWSQCEEVGDMAEEELVEEAQEGNSQNAQDTKGSHWAKYMQTADEGEIEEEADDCVDRNNLHGNENIRKGRGARRETGASRSHLIRPKNPLSVTGWVRGQFKPTPHSRQPSSLALVEGSPQPSVPCTPPSPAYSPPPDVAQPSTRSQPLSAASSALYRTITGGSCQPPRPAPTAVQHTSKWTQFLTAAPPEDDEASEASWSAPTVREEYQTIVPEVVSEADRGRCFLDQSIVNTVNMLKSTVARCGVAEEANSRVGEGRTVSPENKAPVCHQPIPTKHPCSTLSPPTKRPCSTLSPPTKHPCSNLSLPTKCPCSTLSPPTKRPCSTLSPPTKRPCSTLSPPTKRPCPTLSSPTKRPCSTHSSPTKRPCSTLSLGIIFDTGDDFDDTF